ncbi:phosphatidylglycerol/phosphatidylinositol transfer protein [Acrasis kona]|uniref:Phosphatidylglycerol/phosphatidylinositol transfer protein n=1 Tax=Acrasis kona TaxID=1008807 RepID=A0AAW2YY13_9EUKA
MNNKLLLVYLSVLVAKLLAESIVVKTKWHEVVIKSKTTATFQIVTNPLVLPTSPIGAQVYKNIKELNAEWSRFAAWYPYPRMSVAELHPPRCDASVNKTSWDFKLLDPQVTNFLDANAGRTSYLSFCTQPAWLFKDTKVDIPKDYTVPTWSYQQGSKLVDESAQQIADYYARMAAWYSHGGFIDECGDLQKSNHHYNIAGFEVFTVEYYTKVYDKVVAKVRRYLPNAEFIGLSLINPRRNYNYINYFLNSSNHDAGIPLDWISYHFYAEPDDSKPVDSWSKQIFEQTDDFLSHVPEFEKIRKSLSPNTKTTINELGVILGGSATQQQPKPIPDAYWNIAAAQYAYCYVKLASLGIDAVGMSQMVGYPSQYPSVSMVNWETGVGNARYFVLKLINKHIGVQNGNRDVTLVQTEQASSLVFVQSFIVAGKSERWVKKTLILNKSSSNLVVEIDGMTGGELEYLDTTTGTYSDAKQIKTKNAIQVGPYFVGVVTYDE